MAKSKKFKGSVKLIPALHVGAIYDKKIRTAEVNEAVNLLKSKGLMVLRVSPEDKMLFNQWADNFNDLSDRSIPDLDIEIKLKGKSRSLGQNGLYWALIEVLALEVYQENGWADVIHEEILEMYAPKIESKLHKTKIPKRSKDMDTVEFTRLIEGVMYEINQQGISMTDPADIAQYWKNYAKLRFVGGKDLGYREGETMDEYRLRVNYCEACRKYLRPGTFNYSGQLAHIVSRGNSGEDETWNILHLCAKDHLQIQHQNGWEVFLKKYPHLKEKVEIAKVKHSKMFKDKSEIN